MAKQGKRTVFHGAFKTKAAARRKEKATRGAFIQPVTIKGTRRYLVRSNAPKRKPHRTWTASEIGKPKPRPLDRAYKRYLIVHGRPPRQDEIRIEKDGFHIGYARSEAEAEGIIDMLAENPRRRNPPCRCASSNPAAPPEIIYGRALAVEGQMTQPHPLVCDAECKAHGHRYRHDYGRGARILGVLGPTLAQKGDVLITFRKDL